MSVLREAFLDNRIRMIEQVLGIKLTGTSNQEKEDFYKQHEQNLNATTDKILTAMYDVHSGKIKVFQVNHFDWVAAESMDEAIAFYFKSTGLDEDEALEDPAEVEDLEKFMITFDRMNKDDEYYQELGHLQRKYLKDDAAIFKVPAIEILFQEWQGEPYIFCSTEY